MIIIIGLVVLIVLMLTYETVSGVPANPAPFTLTQPDNSSFQARQVGDERASHFETLEGYTIIQDEMNWWNYAKKDEKGKIISIGQRVGFVNPEELGLPKHLHPNPSTLYDSLTPPEPALTVTQIPTEGKATVDRSLIIGAFIVIGIAIALYIKKKRY